MTINVPGVPASRKTPGIFLNVVLGGQGTSAGEAPASIMLMGNKITTALSGVSPTFAVAAGTQADATPVLVSSADVAATLFGRGSEVHLMAAAVFAQYPDALVYGCTSAESAGAIATGVITFATTSTAATTVRAKLSGMTFDVAVALGDTVTTIASNVADAINDHMDLPYTAQNSSGVLTVSAKHNGPRGNNLSIDFYWVDSAGVETRITTSSTSSGAGTTATISGVTTESGAYYLSGGTTADDCTSALAAMAPTRYNRIAVAYIDATNLGRVQTHLETYAGPTEMKWAQAIACSLATLSSSITLATGRNYSRLQIGWHYNSPVPAPSVAAQMAAARLNGDATVGGNVVGENVDPAANLDGVGLAGVIVQTLVADQPLGSEIESALNNGLTPIQPSGSRPGFCSIVRSITTRSLASGVPNYAVLDTSNVTICDYDADYNRSDLAVTFANAKLGVDQANGSPPTAQGVVTPSIVRNRIAYNQKLLEERGIIINVDANLPLLIVEADPGVVGRLNAQIPCEPAPGLHIIAGNVRQLS